MPCPESSPHVRMVSTMLNLDLVRAKKSVGRTDSYCVNTIPTPDHEGNTLWVSDKVRPVKTGSFISHKEITDYVTETCTTAGEIRYNPSPQNRAQQEQGTSP